MSICIPPVRRLTATSLELAADILASAASHPILPAARPPSPRP